MNANDTIKTVRSVDRDALWRAAQSTWNKSVRRMLLALWQDQPQPAKVVFGEWETRNFRFTAIGPSESAVKDTISCAWLVHCADVIDQTGYECDLSLFNKDEVNCTEMTEGIGYEDGVQVCPRKG